MPIPVRPFYQTLGEFYAAYWDWWHAAHRPLGPTLEPFRRDDTGWAGVDTPTGPRVRAGIAFSGTAGTKRVIKAEIYVGDAVRNARWTNVVLPRVASGVAPFDLLWTKVESQVHWHPDAGAGHDPGVTAYRDADGRHPNDAVHRPEAFGPSPTVPVPGAVSIGQFGMAGRIATFHRDTFDLTNAADVEAAGAWMANAFTVFETVLASL